MVACFKDVLTIMLVLLKIVMSLYSRQFNIQETVSMSNPKTT